MNTRAIGQLGEEAARQYLKENGYTLLSSNVLEGHEELDIVAERGSVRAFVEVKTRSSTPTQMEKYGSPAMAVTPLKRRHLLSAARQFNRDHPTKKDSRMDIIEVYLSKDEPPRILHIHHMKDAFRT